MEKKIEQTAIANRNKKNSNHFRENFLTDTLSAFFRNVSDSAAENGALRNKAERFRLHLTRYFKWDFDQEPEEDLPQVVELNSSIP